MSSKIVLTMIVKNEEHVIERALRSCYNMIDSYCIVDTGSTDNTKEIIKNFFDSKKINGKIIDFEFTNFEECRNQSIIHAKELGEYGFWMDADEQLVLSDTFNKKIFSDMIKKDKFDQYLIDCQYGGMTYTRAQFYRFDNGYYWYGPVHEVIKSDNESKIGKFNFGHMYITPDGNSWKTDDLSDKYQKHAEILLKYQEKHEWKDPRWTFYLAQSYRDAANIRLQKNPNDELGKELCKKGISYYEKRTKQTEGFYQEIYYSQLSLARLSVLIEPKEIVLNNFMKCEELNIDNRVEHIFNIGTLLQSLNLHKSAILYLKQGLKYLKDGCNSSLFIENHVYDWALYDMYGISLYYTGKIPESLKYFNYALKKLQNGNTNNPEIKRVENNVKSAENAIREHNSRLRKDSIKI